MSSLVHFMQHQVTEYIQQVKFYTFSGLILTLKAYINIFLNNFPCLVTVLFLLNLGLQQTIIRMTSSTLCTCITSKQPVSKILWWDNCIQSTIKSKHSAIGILTLKHEWAVTSEILMCFSRHWQKSKQCVRKYTT